MDNTVVGMDHLLAKQSAVSESGKLRNSAIEGVEFRATRPVAHADGHMTEVARASWDILASPIVQVHMTTTLPGRVRGWELHRETSDRLFVVSGLVRIVVFDGRQQSPTFGKINEFLLSEKTPGLLVIAPHLYHGWKNVGASEAVIVNMPDRMYNYEAPDSLILPWESEAARELIPHRW